MAEQELSLEDVFVQDGSSSTHDLGGSWGFSSVERRLDLNLSLDLEQQEGRMQRVLERLSIPASTNSTTRQDDELRKLPTQRREMAEKVDTLEEELVATLSDIRALGEEFQQWRANAQQSKQQQHQESRDAIKNAVQTDDDDISMASTIISDAPSIASKNKKNDMDTSSHDNGGGGSPDKGKRFLVIPFITLISTLLLSMIIPHLILYIFENQQTLRAYYDDDEAIIDWKVDIILPVLYRSLILPFFTATTVTRSTAAATAVAEPNNIWMIYKLIQQSVSYILSYVGVESITVESILPNVTPFVCNSLLFITMIPAIEMTSLKLTNIKLLQGTVYCTLCVYMLAYNHGNDGGGGGGGDTNNNNYHEMALVTCMSVMALLVVGRQKRITTKTPVASTTNQGATITTKQKQIQQRRSVQQQLPPIPPTTMSSATVMQQQQQRPQQMPLTQHLRNQNLHHRQRRQEHSMLMDIHNLLYFQTTAWGVISLLFPLNLEEDEEKLPTNGRGSAMAVKLVVYGTYLALVSHVLRTPPKWMSTALQYMTISQVFVAFIVMEFFVPFLKNYFGGSDSSSGMFINSIHDEFIPLLLASISCTGGLIGCWALSFWVLCRHHDHDL